jgi:L-seryl-tRNA(Ser) seleniumtransferase
MPKAGTDYYRKLGVRRSINAVGAGTTVGGSGPPKAVREAMETASLGYVRMDELSERSGAFLADLLGTEAVYITSGGAAALTMSTAACMAGTDPDKIYALPVTTGMKSEVLVQKKHQASYDRCLRAAGATLVEVGGDESCTNEELEAAIGPNTAAIYYAHPPYGDYSLITGWAHPPGDPDLVSVDDAARIGRENDVPVIVDGGEQVWPLDHFRKVAQVADLVCFGGKYYGGPNASGFVCGRKDLIEAVAAQGFTAPLGVMGIGRQMKLDRQQIVAIVAALDRWFSMDHEDRMTEQFRRFSVVRDALKGVSGINVREQVRTDAYYGSFLEVFVDSEALGRDAGDIVDQMYEGEPSVLIAGRGDMFRVFFHTLDGGDAETIATRLTEVLTA